MTHLPDAREALSLGRKMTKEELSRALRISIADEYEAIQIYFQIAESIDDEGMKKVIMHIIHEEQKHAGHLLDLLNMIGPSEAKAYEQATKENKELVGRSGK